MAASELPRKQALQLRIHPMKPLLTTLACIALAFLFAHVLLG